MDKLLESIQPLLDIPFVRRVRRNHGLEHASIHMLSRKVKNLSVVGRSDARGFYLYGDIPTELIEEALADAHERMRNGQHGLAIHPNCGTNLLTTASLSVVAVLTALVGSERSQQGRLSRLPVMMLGIMLAVVFSQPLGRSLQENVTTLGDLGDLEVLSISRRQRGRLTIHRIDTRST